MRLTILGSAAGGGFPQWNCNCRNCHGVREGSLRARTRTQSSAAICSADRVLLVNASPDIARQLASHVPQPTGSLRDNAIAAVVLADAQLDHTVGLFSLRESAQPLDVWCTDAVDADLRQGHRALDVLAHYCGVARRRMPLGERFRIAGFSDLRFTSLAVSGKPPPFSPNRHHPIEGDNIALEVMNAPSGKTLVFAPGVAAIDDALWRALHSAACVLIDGTFWRDEEMIELGVGRRRARELGHLPLFGPRRNDRVARPLAIDNAQDRHAYQQHQSNIG